MSLMNCVFTSMTIIWFLTITLCIGRDFPIPGTNLNMVYWSNMDILNPSTDPSLIEKAVIVVHGLGRDVKNYYDLTVSAAKSSGYNVDNGDILLIALKYHDEASANPDSLWWTSNPDGGWIKGASANNAQTISSYEVVDRFIEYLNIDAADSFTNLQETVLLGHSAGGQLVQRYALTNKLDTDNSCGYIPASCVEDLKWAINTGVSTNAEWYPDFETVTGRKLTDELTMDDMALYFHCKGTNTDNCGGITAPCGRACPSDVGSCGNIPSTCTPHLEWAINTGRFESPHFYADFESVTGTALTDDITVNDMALYFHCKNINEDVNGDCTGLEIPCSRSCGNKLNDKIHFVVIAPTSFAYIDERRYFGSTFRTPTSSEIASCSAAEGTDCGAYNSWKFGFDDYDGNGLQHYNEYFASDSLENSKRLYIGRKLTYLCGENDNGGFFAPFQGDNRLQRSMNWMNAMRTIYGNAADEKHEFMVIPGAGHNSADVIPASVTRNVVFGQ